VAALRRAAGHFEKNKVPHKSIIPYNMGIFKTYFRGCKTSCLLVMHCGERSIFAATESY
jgi:hypothetical protein